ncbi:MAG TPA: hypothetical protein VJH21_00195 [Candidatus Paceibacterota bacterium]
MTILTMPNGQALKEILEIHLKTSGVAATDLAKASVVLDVVKSVTIREGHEALLEIIERKSGELNRETTRIKDEGKDPSAPEYMGMFLEGMKKTIELQQEMHKK